MTPAASLAPMVLAARRYAAQGLHVFACAPGGKQPATAHGCNDATTDTKAIETMWRDPRRNVAIACGPSRLLVLDVDGARGAEALAHLEREHGALPPTPEVLTARGRHLYFRGAGRNSASKLGPGLDTRGLGGYVLAPPSVHPSGHVYRWAPGRGIHEIGIAQPPQWIVDALAPHHLQRVSASINPCGELVGAYGLTALSRECAAVVNSREGTRNHTLNCAAFSVGQLVGAGALDESLALAALLEAGRRAGLPAREILSTVNSGFIAGKREPRKFDA